jgi:hypothetical protein
MATLPELEAWIAERQVVLVSAIGSLPCATAAIAGRSISGSWWGDRDGGLIYGLLEALDDAAEAEAARGAGSVGRAGGAGNVAGGVISCSLVDGKQTFVAASLRTELERVAGDHERRARLTAQLGAPALGLLGELADGPVTQPDRRARVSLEASLLVTSR